MSKKFNAIFFSSLLVFSLLAIFQVNAVAISAAETVHFKVRVDASLVQSDAPLAGRLLIFMTNNPKSLDNIEPDFTNPDAVYISGIEINNLEANKIIEVDADLLAFPKKFSEAPAGEYQIMALLDQDHS